MEAMQKHISRVSYGMQEKRDLLYKPEMKEGNPIRLYSLDEITEIFGKLVFMIF